MPSRSPRNFSASRSGRSLRGTTPTSEVGSSIHVMVKISKRLVPQRHLKYAGISMKTRARYQKVLKMFFKLLDIYEHRIPMGMASLDFLAGEFVNHLYQEMEPYGDAGDFVSTLKRFYPPSRMHVVTPDLFSGTGSGGSA